MTYEEFLKRSSPSTFASAVALAKLGFSWETSGVNAQGQWAGGDQAISVKVNVFMHSPQERHRYCVWTFDSFADFEAAVEGLLKSEG